jgi:hypothetical protein
VVKKSPPASAKSGLLRPVRERNVGWSARLHPRRKGDPVKAGVRVQIETTADQAEVEKKAAAAEPGCKVSSIAPLQRAPDSPLVEARFVDPVTITATVTLALVAVRMVNHWLKSEERGVQIDLRTQPPTISHLRNVPAGVLVIIDKAGKASVQRQAYDKPEDLMPALTKIFAGASGAS